ncbi:MAG: hypothetical protein Q9165_003737 [Trypethelium subeluteriae]
MPTANWDPIPDDIFEPTCSGEQKRTLESVPGDESPDYVVKLASEVDRQGHWLDYNHDRTTMQSWSFPGPNGVRQAYGLRGLHGCTSVIIASEKGVFISHIWEAAFSNNDESPTDDKTFSAQSSEALQKGTMQDGSDGLQALTQPGQILHRDYKPAIFIATPLTDDWERRNLHITTPTRYEARTTQLGNSVRQLVPGAGAPKVQSYYRTERDVADDISDFAGKAIVEVDPHQAVLESEDDKSRPIGAWRAWIEFNKMDEQAFLYPAPVERAE